MLEQYLLKDDGSYDLVLKSSSGSVRSDVIAGFELAIDAIFDEAKNLEALRAMMGR